MWKLGTLYFLHTKIIHPISRLLSNLSVREVQLVLEASRLLLRGSRSELHELPFSQDKLCQEINQALPRGFCSSSSAPVELNSTSGTSQKMFLMASHNLGMLWMYLFKSNSFLGYSSPSSSEISQSWR